MKFFPCSTQLGMRFHILIKTKTLNNDISCFKTKLLGVVFILLINVKMPIVVGILTFMSRINIIFRWVEHENSFITCGLSLFFGEMIARHIKNLRQNQKSYKINFSKESVQDYIWTHTIALEWAAIIATVGIQYILGNY